LELLRRKSFKLVISDLNMVPMTGLQLLQEIRADRGLAELLAPEIRADFLDLMALDEEMAKQLQEIAKFLG
jgi:CheY-like chemotaxis protein